MNKNENSRDELTTKQQRAVMALLSEKTNMAAAKAAGISEATLWRWKHTPAFQRAYSTAGRAAYERAVASVGLLAVEAVEALREVMTDSNAPASSRVTAAKVVLDGALAGIELFEMERRLAELEAAQAMLEGGDAWRAV